MNNDHPARSTFEQFADRYLPAYFWTMTGFFSLGIILAALTGVGVPIPQWTTLSALWSGSAMMISGFFILVLTI